MAAGQFTLPELVTINDRNLADVEVPNFFATSPFMATNAATVASHDTTHKWLRYTLPDTGFRQPNNGRVLQKSVDTMVSTDCKIIDASFKVDIALAREYRKGGESGWLNRELARHLTSAMLRLEQQVFQGTATAAAPSEGFVGLPDLAELQDLSDNLVINGGGSTASSQTSVYMVRSGAEDVEIVTGRSGDIQVGSPTIQETAGADQGQGAVGVFPAIYVPVTAWYALKVGSTVSSVARICNVENSLTDDMLYEAYSKFGVGRKPTHIYMTRKALELLRSSRTAVNTEGSPAGNPTALGGIPILLTEGISETEAVVT